MPKAKTPKTPPLANILGYSLRHYAIVQVESKSKKPTKAAQSAAMDAVEKDHPERIILGSTFIKTGGMGTGDKPCETWVIEYVRPSGNSNAMSTQG